MILKIVRYVKINLFAKDVIMDTSFMMIPVKNATFRIARNVRINLLVKDVIK